ncbi:MULTISPECIES: hypothetical protein [Sphingobacterium]|uniref:Uncharacterized protein n=1 Tax=Sphingobacterium tenebrionis TaxID=3111775 RepID=A0ABU8I6Q2_9SPHI|nr:hypothetical protein [Sphingobacterium sp. CZ-2]QBR13291.1 hypothetical protein E3D81_14390 [Sphingobacterium sp. CZ-2]
MKKKYSSPDLQYYEIAIENSIATGSARATFIGPNNEASPDVDPWNFNPDSQQDNPTHTEDW